jgi:hypothetical protein
VNWVLRSIVIFVLVGAPVTWFVAEAAGMVIDVDLLYSSGPDWAAGVPWGITAGGLAVILAETVLFVARSSRVRASLMAVLGSAVLVLGVYTAALLQPERVAIFPDNEYPLCSDPQNCE